MYFKQSKRIQLGYQCDKRLSVSHRIRQLSIRHSAGLYVVRHITIPLYHSHVSDFDNYNRNDLRIDGNSVFDGQCSIRVELRHHIAGYLHNQWHGYGLLHFFLSFDLLADNHRLQR
jgi:hypothetical protein